MRDKLNDSARLDLILESISNIEGFLAGTTSCDEFIASKILCHAVIYNLQCIGESVYRLSREFITSHPGMDWEAIEGLRHVLVHDYYTVNMRTVWMIIERDLPGLKEYVKSL
ncbi:MAG: DUF86 domain-containing protein [Bacteroidales bacterium]|nr:DUF86 domain-containing protein [Bacteroidales bacterium]